MRMRLAPRVDQHANRPVEVFLAAASDSGSFTARAWGRHAHACPRSRSIASVAFATPPPNPLGLVEMDRAAVSFYQVDRRRLPMKA